METAARCQVFQWMICFDEQDRPVGHDDVHTKIETCRRHLVAVGLGEDFVSRFVR